MKDIRTTAIGASLLVVAGLFCAFTPILNTTEGKGIISLMTLAAGGFVMAKDAAK